MNNFLRIGLFTFFIFAIISASLFYFNFDSASTAAEHTLFITIDKNEFAHIQNVARAKQGEFQYDFVDEQNGIAVLKISESQLPTLSGFMHDEYHKCGGFISHESLADANFALSNLQNNDSNAPEITYTIDNQQTVTTLLQAANSAQILQIIQTLSAFPNRRHNLQSGLDSASWIKNKWTEIVRNRSDIRVEFFNHPASVTPQPSVILTIPGTQTPNEIVVLGAHQDSINTSSQTANAPGADDDASGVASLTEALRVLVEKNFRPKKTVQFMAYAAEEVGLKGSNDIAANYVANNKNVIGVFQLDMTNYQPTGGFDVVIFTDYTNAAQNQFIRDLITNYFPAYTVGTSSCGYGCSDHASWNNRGIPASFPFESTFSTSNNKIHTANDTLAQSGNNANHALKFTKLAISYIGELAKGSVQTAQPSKARFDFDGDGRSDVSVFRASEGNWYINQSANGFTASTFGAPTDRIVPADYDGDGKTDVAVFRDGYWYIMKSGSGFSAVQFGAGSDIPQPADYDGDGKTDVAVFRPSNGSWYVLGSQNGFFAAQFGADGDKPVAADFDGDSKADFAVFRDGYWYILNTNDGFKVVQFGVASDFPMANDFDGDGKTDVAVFRAGYWYILRTNGGFLGLQFGSPTDLPVPADYDGDGKTDVAVFRSGDWYQLKSSNGGFYGEVFGVPTDKPIPSAYNR